MQSTGHTSTHAASFVPIQGSVMMNAIPLSLHKNGAVWEWRSYFENRMKCLELPCM